MLLCVSHPSVRSCFHTEMLDTNTNTTATDNTHTVRFSIYLRPFHYIYSFLSRCPKHLKYARYVYLLGVLISNTYTAFTVHTLQHIYASICRSSETKGLTFYTNSNEKHFSCIRQAPFSLFRLSPTRTMNSINWKRFSFKHTYGERWENMTENI